MPSMGLDIGLNTRACKRKHRWLMFIDDVVGISDSGGVNLLPPLKSGRPQLIFKEMVAKHLNEDVYYPARPEWKPINLTLYDIKTDNPAGTKFQNHPVFNWIRSIYIPHNTDPFGDVANLLGVADEPIRSGTWRPPLSNNFFRDARLKLFDGCGNTIETWVYEQAWPQSVNFQDLDMGNSQILTCDITLRYVRAYVDN